MVLLKKLPKEVDSMVESKDVKEEKTQPKEEKPMSFEEFKEIYHKQAFMRICPWFCLMMKCPYFKECWGLEREEE